MDAVLNLIQPVAVWLVTFALVVQSLSGPRECRCETGCTVRSLCAASPPACGCGERDSDPSGTCCKSREAPRTPCPCWKQSSPPLGKEPNSAAGPAAAYAPAQQGMIAADDGAASPAISGLPVRSHNIRQATLCVWRK